MNAITKTWLIMGLLFTTLVGSGLLFLGRSTGWPEFIVLSVVASMISSGIGERPFRYFGSGND